MKELTVVPLGGRRVVTWPALFIVISLLITTNPKASPVEGLLQSLAAGIVGGLLVLPVGWLVDRVRQKPGWIRLPNTNSRRLWLVGSVLVVVALRLAGGGGALGGLIACVALVQLRPYPAEEIEEFIAQSASVPDLGKPPMPAVVTVPSSRDAKIESTEIVKRGETADRRRLQGLSWRAFAQATALIMVAAASLWAALNIRLGSHHPTNMRPAGETVEENLTSTDFQPSATNGETLSLVATGAEETGGTANDVAVAVAKRAREMGFYPYVHVDDCSVVLSPPDVADTRDSTDIDAIDDRCRGKLHLSNQPFPDGSGPRF